MTSSNPDRRADGDFRMPRAKDLAHYRHFYAEELRAIAPVRHWEAVVRAFAAVPRELFLGSGPWRIRPPDRPSEIYQTQDDDPRRIHHNVLVVLDETRELNNGLPSFWAWIFDHLDLR